MQSLKLNKPHLLHVFGFTELLISKYLLRHLSLPCLHIIMSSPLITSFGFSFNCLPFSFPLCQGSEPGNRNHCYLKQKEIQYRELRLKELLRGWSCLLLAPKQDHQSGSPGGFYLCHNQAGGLQEAVTGSVEFKNTPHPGCNSDVREPASHLTKALKTGDASNWTLENKPRLRTTLLVSSNDQHGKDGPHLTSHSRKVHLIGR